LSQMPFYHFSLYEISLSKGNLAGLPEGRSVLRKESWGGILPLATALVQI
jgi:hypothetical protein